MMIEETFDEHGDSRPKTVKHHQPDHMVDDIRRFGMFSVLDNST